MPAHRRRGPLVAAAALLLLGACTGDGDAGTTTTSPPEATTGPPITAPTTVPVTATTTAPPTTGNLPPPDSGRVLAAGDTDLVEIDLATGEVASTLVEFFSGDGTFRGGIRLSADGDTVYYDEGWEDYWFSCEASRGITGFVPAAGGRPRDLGSGMSPAPSPDGRYLARIDSTLCLPDPENPEAWVLTPFNAVVVTHLESGEEAVHELDAEPAATDDPAALRWVGWHPGGDLVALDWSGALHRFGVGSAGAIDGGDPVLTGLGPEHEPIDVAGGRLLVVAHTAELSAATVSLMDLDTGAVTDLMEVDGFATAGVDPDGRVVVAVSPADDFAAPSVLRFETGGEIPLGFRVTALDW